MAMILEALGHRILIQPNDLGEKTHGGLYLPEQVRVAERFKTTRGKIMDIGRNAWKSFDDGAPWAAVGDEVVFAKYGGQVIEDDDGNEFRIVNDEDLYARVHYVE